MRAHQRKCPAAHVRAGAKETWRIEDSKAGISKATFFRYFESLGSMRYDAVARMLERFPVFHVADPGKGPLGERIERFVALRVAFWEKVHRMALLQRSTVLRDPGTARMVDLVRKGMAGAGYCGAQDVTT